MLLLAPRRWRPRHRLRVWPVFRSWACRWLVDAASLRRRPTFRLFSAFAYAASGYYGYAGLRKRNRSAREGVATTNTTAERANISMEIFVAIYLLFGPLIGWTPAMRACARLSFVRGYRVGSAVRSVKKRRLQDQAQKAARSFQDKAQGRRHRDTPRNAVLEERRSVSTDGCFMAAMAALLQNLRNRSEYAKSPGASDGCAGTPLCFPFIFQPHPAAWKKSPFCRLLYDCPAPRQTAPADASAHRSASSARRWSP